MSNLIQQHLEAALKQIKRYPVPIALVEYISEAYDGNCKRFAEMTGRHPNSVRHQVSRDAIFYKGKVYCPVKGE